MSIRNNHLKKQVPNKINQNVYVNFTNNRKPSSRKSILFFKNKKNLFIFGCTVFTAAWALPWLWSAALSSRWRLVLWRQALGREGFSSCDTWAQQLQALELRLNSVAHGLSRPLPCVIFLDQGLNSCPCIGRWILNHCTTREAPKEYFSMKDFKCLIFIEKTRLINC